VAAILPFIAMTAVLVLYIRTLWNALRRCSPDSQAMRPGKVWLLLVPIFNFYWHFVVVREIARTLHTESQRRAVRDVPPKPGQAVGMALCTLSVAAFALGQVFRAVAGPGAPSPATAPLALALATACLVLFIAYWAKIRRYTRQLQLAAPPDVEGAQAMLGSRRWEVEARQWANVRNWLRKRIYGPQLIATLMLLWGLVPDNPYPYYILLRWVCCGVFAYLATKAFRQKLEGWTWLLGITAALYNPILRADLTRGLWAIVNVVTIGIAVASVVALTSKGERQPPP
jgi:hypothetical protein